MTLFLVLLYNLYFAKKEIYFIAYMFIIMHELSHMIMALILNVDIKEIMLLPFGATAKYDGKLNPIKELLISIAGPMASLLFANLYNNYTYFVINLLIFIFNMIPIYPLDGGRIVKIFLTFFLGEKKTQKIINVLNIFLVYILSILAIILFIKYRNFSLFLVVLYIIRILKEEYEKGRIQSIINYLQIDE